MDADWYEDPLGRYEGRFFDGASWTERVSVDGRLEIDADFLASIEGSEAKQHDATPFAESATAAVAPAVDHGATQDNETKNETEDNAAPFAESDEPAVAPVANHGATHASMIAESPARVVAVLDDSLMRRVGADGATTAASSKRPLAVAGLVALIAVLAIAAYVLIRNDSPTNASPAPIALDAEQEDRVEDLAAGSSDSADSDQLTELEATSGEDMANETDFDATDAIDVGGSTIVNGVSLLRDLEQWHVDFADERGVALGAEAGCWFGHLGGAAVQAVQCGPVGGDEETEYRFDLVPLVFEDAATGQIAQAVVDDVTIDAVLANTLTLVGAPEGAAPPVTLDEAAGGGD